MPGLRTKEILWANLYPRVKDGSAIFVVEKHKKEKKEQDGERTPVDWNNILTGLSTGITSALTIYVLYLTVKSNP